MSTQPLNFGAQVAPTPFPGTDFGGAGGGSNQWMGGWPGVPFPGNGGGGTGAGTDTGNTGFTGGQGMKDTSSSPPGVVPPSSSGLPPSASPFTGPSNAPGITGIGKGLFAENPIDPSLTSNFFSWLQSQIGQGVSPFDLSALLPSSGQATGAGQLSAPLTQVLQQMQQMFMPGGQIGDMAANGVSAIPAWQSMVDAMQRQIGQGATNLKEQFNIGGGLVGSPYGSAAADYQMQSNKDLNAQLGQMQFQGIQDQLQAAGMEGSFGQMMQGLDQSSIDRMLQEFIRTSPQNNPLLSMMFGGSTTFAPVVNPKSGAGGLGGLLGGAGGAASGIADLLPMIMSFL